MIVFSVLSFIGTILIYKQSQNLYDRWNIFLFSPLLLSPLLIIILLSVSRMPYSNYTIGAQWLSKMLGPATVAFAIPLYRNFDLLKKHAIVIIISVSLGSLVAITTSVLFGTWLHMSPQIIDSIAPRSVTTPIAMDISQTLGGIPTITAVFVILTALIGLIVGPTILRYLPIRHQVAKGVLLGTAAHGSGASTGFGLGHVEGTIASLAMILAAGVTLLLAPWLVPFIQLHL